MFLIVVNSKCSLLIMIKLFVGCLLNDVDNVVFEVFEIYV